jgi:hypothetical protein
MAFRMADAQIARSTCPAILVTIVLEIADLLGVLFSVPPESQSHSTLISRRRSS